MASEDSNKLSSSPKVPPLKIVFSSHHTNAVVNISTSDGDNQLKPSDRDEGSHDHLDYKELGRKNSLETNDGPEKQPGHHKRQHVRGSSDKSESDKQQHPPTKAATGFSSSSSSSSSSDRSNTTTPSSESESLASNSTIISDHHQQYQHQNKQGKTTDQKHVDEKQHERNSKTGHKVSNTTNSSSCSVGVSGKRLHESNSGELGQAVSDTTSSKEQILNANQRITRSSQRAALQIKTENPSISEANGDEVTTSENQDKTHESARKVKRRKGDIQESEQDANQITTQPPVIMATVHPADYQLPSQNSFELYRDIRKRPYKKLMKLNYIQPRVPHGFKDYLMNGGPYLLDGDKLGIGLNGLRVENPSNNNYNNNSDQANNGINIKSTSRAPLRMKLSNLQKLSSYQPSHQRHTSYTIPKISEAPRNLQVGSPLYELFLDQEKARHQMRMQHLKERERSILTSEQEILRAYNKAAIADNKQKFHLSACTYFYYQERYHYLDKESVRNGKSSLKEVPHSQDNSFLCIEGGEAATKSLDDTKKASSKDLKNSLLTSDDLSDREKNADKEETSNNLETDPIGESSIQTKTEKTESEQTTNKEDVKMSDDASIESDKKDIQQSKNAESSPNGLNIDESDPLIPANGSCSRSVHLNDDSSITNRYDEIKESSKDSLNTKDIQVLKNLDLDSDNSSSESSSGKEDPNKSMSDEDLKILNKEALLNQLQEIDDKWERIKRDMLVRHKNEADSLHAIQSLDWEWKAKEIGACDVRVSLKIEPEFVPKVEVFAADY